jgi:hypothetical protein
MDLITKETLMDCFKRLWKRERIFDVSFLNSLTPHNLLNSYQRIRKDDS